MALVLKKGTRLILAGVVIGLLTGFILARMLASEFWGISATDPSTFAAVALVALIVGVLACWLPAHRATKVDPLVALRYE